MDKLEEIYDYIVDAKREDTESNVFNKVDIKDSKEYIRAVSGVGETQLNEIQKHAQHEELARQIEEIKTYGTNKHFFTTHHRIMLQEEVVLTLFEKVQE